MTAARIRGFGMGSPSSGRNLNCIRPVDRELQTSAYSRHMERLVPVGLGPLRVELPWAFWAISCVVPFPIYLYLASGVVAFEHSDRYLAAVGATLCDDAVSRVRIGAARRRPIADWWSGGLPGENIDAATAFGEATTAGAAARSSGSRGLWVCAGRCWRSSPVNLQARADHGLSSTHYWVLPSGRAATLLECTASREIAMRPVRVTLVEGTAIGDSLPRSRPRFAAWSNLAILAVAFAFSIATAMVTATFEQLGRSPAMMGVALASALTLAIGSRSPSEACSPRRCTDSRPCRRHQTRGGGDYTNDCRWCRMTTSGHSRHHSTACRPDWLSGNVFRWRSAPMSIRPWRRAPARTGR